MATNIRLKSSSVTGKTPTLSSLSLRELAVNTTDGKLFLRKGDGSSTDKIIDVTGPLQASEPMGHEDRTQSAISFNTTNRRFTIQPVSTSFNVWCKGIKYTYTTAQTVDLPNTSGIYYIYFDGDGVLQYRQSYFDWENDAPTAYVYWNATTGTAPFVADERHGIVLDWQTHEYLHRTRGAVIANGFSISNYTTSGTGANDADAQFDLGGGTFFDEDLEVLITHSNTPTSDTWQQDLQGPSQIPVFYRSGNAWVRDSVTSYALKQGTARIQYNYFNGTSWSAIDVPSNTHYTTSWIIATNNINYPVIAVMGQSEHNKISDQESIGFGDLVLDGFPVVEFRPLWKIIWQTNSTYANTPNARIAGVYDIRQLSAGGGFTGATPVSDHGLLTGLGDDDHLQYFHLTNTRVGITAELNTTGKITTTNNVGIGTASPSSKLDIVGGNISLASSSDPRIYIQTTGIGGAGFDIKKSDDSWSWRFTAEPDGFKIRDHFNSLDKFYIEDGATGNVWFNNIGNIGIGTEVPISKVHAIVGTSRFVVETTATELNSPLNLWNNNSSVSAGSGMVFSATTNLNQDINSVFIGGVASQRIGSDLLNSRTAFRVLSNGVLSDTASNAVFYLEGSATGPKIIANGNVGIGTTNPTHLLHLYNSTSNQVAINLQNANTGGNAWLIQSSGGSSNIGQGNFSIYDWNADTYRLLISPSGNVGIGTTNPGSILAVNGYITESTDNGVTYHNVVTQQDIGFNANQIPLNQYLGQLAFMDAYSPSGLRRDGGGSDDVVVNSSGFVGIGTTNPDRLLHIRGGSDNGIIVDSTTGYPAIWWAENGTRKWSATTNLNSDGAFVIRESSVADRLTILTGGNVGIGTTNPTSKLHVSGGDLHVNSLDDSDVDIKLGVHASNANFSVIRSIRASNSQSILSFNVSNGGLKEVAQFHYDEGLYVKGMGDGLSAGNAGLITFSDQSGAWLAQITSYKTGVDDETDLIFATSDGFYPNEKLRITANGNVGVGTEGPTTNTRLHIREDNETTFRCRTIIQSTDQKTIIGSHWESGVTQYSFIQGKNDAETTNTVLLLNPEGANVGIGTTNPTSTLHVQGSARITGSIVSTNYFTTTSTGSVTGGVAIPISNISSTSYRSVEYIIQAVSTTNHQVTKLLLVHNGTNAYITEYGSMTTNTQVASYTADISNNSIVVTATPTSANATNFKVYATAIAV